MQFLDNTFYPAAAFFWCVLISFTPGHFFFACCSMKTFVMGDIHGAYRALLQCLQRAGFDNEKDILIQLGDVTDGYGHVFECVETLLSIKHLIPLMGNHDDWLGSFIKTDFHPQYWNYGGKATLLSYLHHAGKTGQFFATRSGYKTALVSGDIPQSHQEFFNRQQRYYIDDDQRCFVHAGFNRHLAFDKQKTEDFYWDRTLWSEALHAHTFNRNITTSADFFNGTSFSEIYIGHTPTTKFDTDKPLQALNIFNLDTGAGHSGRLTIMNVATKEYWQSDPLPELYPHNFRQPSQV